MARKSAGRTRSSSAILAFGRARKDHGLAAVAFRRTADRLARYVASRDWGVTRISGGLRSYQGVRGRATGAGAGLPHDRRRRDHCDHRPQRQRQKHLAPLPLGPGDTHARHSALARQADPPGRSGLCLPRASAHALAHRPPATLPSALAICRAWSAPRRWRRPWLWSVSPRLRSACPSSSRAAWRNAWRWPVRIAPHPELLLLDEPLSALDPLTRETMQHHLLHVAQQGPRHPLADHA